MFGFGKWLISKLTPAPAATTNYATQAWMKDPDYACALTLPRNQLSQEDVDRTLQQLAAWANKEGKWEFLRALENPATRPILHISIGAPAKQWPNGFQFTDLSPELAHWITASFPSVRLYTVYVWKHDDNLAQLADIVSSVLLSPAWAQQVTRLNLGFNEPEVAWAALDKLEEFPSLKHLYFLSHVALCPSPKACIVSRIADAGGGGNDKWIQAEGPRRTLLLPCLARLEYFELDNERDNFYAISYSLRTFLAPPTLLQGLWLGIFIHRDEIDDFLAELLTATPTIPTHIYLISVDLPYLNEQVYLSRLVELLPNLVRLQILTELSLLVIMRTLEPLPYLIKLKLILVSAVAQLPEDDVDDEDHISDLQSEPKPKMMKLTHLILHFVRVAHGSIKAAQIQELFPSASIKAGWGHCSTCGISVTTFSNVCWSKILVGTGISRI